MSLLRSSSRKVLATVAAASSATSSSLIRRAALSSFAAAASRSTKFAPLQTPLVSQTRGVKTLDFGGSKETVWERADFPKEKLQEIFKDDVMAVIGYGTQGMAQSLNMRDNGLNVIIGLRKDGYSWEAAKKDGWIPGKTLYFSHGFSIVYHEQTGVIAPKDVDVILAAPKGSGATVRSLFLEGRGINSSVAVWQDVSGKARERAFALGVGIGSGYLYETTFQKEVFSDLTGERGVLMGAIQGIFKAQYEVLRAKGHSPSEAFNETVEEATQSLYPLIGARGMDWMYANCSTTARRGALDWAPEFYEATKPVFQRLYASVENGSETARSLDYNNRPDYREAFEAELKEIRESEMWRAGVTVRSLRPENVN